MIAVDATVLSDLLTGDAALQHAALSLANEDPEWISVGLWRYELGNVLWKYVRFQQADRALLRVALEGAETLLLETIEVLDLPTIWEIACTTGLTFYDSSYVWLARSRGIKLRTRDRQILETCRDVALPMPIVKQ